jgi:glycosyltransferase involved in cell wall biosynthesis
MSVPQVTIVVPGRWHAFDLARELETLGALHRIVTNYPRSRTRRWGIPDGKVVSLPLTLALTKLAAAVGGESFAMRQQFRISELFARKAARHIGSPDILHAWSGAAEPSVRAAHARGIATVLERSSSHMLTQCQLLQEEYASLGMHWEETPQVTVQRELREYDLAAKVFVPSRFVHRSFVARKFPEAKLFLNGFGVDTKQFAPGPKADDVFRVVYAGSLSVRKGIHHLVAAFRASEIPASELLLIGGATAETPRLLGGSDPRIRCVGHVPQAALPALYRTASVFAMASIEEGQALVQAQALACGLPLICTTNTGGEDFLALDSEGETVSPGVRRFAAGYVVSAGESAPLVVALRELAEEPKRLVAMRSATGRYARRDLSWRRYALANLEAYSALLGMRERAS